MRFGDELLRSETRIDGSLHPAFQSLAHEQSKHGLTPRTSPLSHWVSFLVLVTMHGKGKLASPVLQFQQVNSNYMGKDIGVPATESKDRAYLKETLEAYFTM